MRTETSVRTPVLEVRGLGMAYDGHIAIERLDLTVRSGEFVAIVGPSGCGKSTLLNILSGLLRPTEGHLSVQGRELYGADAHRPRLGYVFQDHRLLPWRSVRRNIEFVLRATQIPRDQWAAITDELLDMLHIGRYADRWPMRLSGGERQRVSIARALAVRPPFILMDEPLSTLDEVTARSLRQELVDVWARTGQTMVYVTHSIREAVFLADRIVILSRGPASVVEDYHVPIERPREYEDPRIAAVESEIIEKVLDVWGLDRLLPEPDGG